MFVAASVYARSVQFIDMSDIEFFEESLRLAKTRVTVDADKMRSPVVFASTLSKLTKTECESVSRSLMSSSRARRRFIMLDVDYNPGEESKLRSLALNVRDLAKHYKTPCLVYPTLSYPAKPRVRVVFFAKRVMTAASYYKAVMWLSDQLGYEITDVADADIRMNRNLPTFSNDDQVAAVWDNMSQVGQVPLDNKLWANVPGPPEKKFFKTYSSTYRDSVDLAFDVDALAEAIAEYAKRKNISTYAQVWRLVESIADEVRRGSLPSDNTSVDKLMSAIASVAPDSATYERWRLGNIELFDKLLDRLETGQRSAAFVKPLLSIDPHFANIAIIAIDENTQEDDG